MAKRIWITGGSSTLSWKHVALQFLFTATNLFQYNNAPVQKAQSSIKTWCVKVGVEEIECPCTALSTFEMAYYSNEHA